MLAQENGCEITRTFEGATLHDFDVGQGHPQAERRVANRELEQKTTG
jgi:hypothetical protein